MRCTVLVNDPAELGPRQTTTMLIRQAVARGHAAYIAGVTDLSCTALGAVQVQARRVLGAFDTREQLVAHLREATPAPVALDAMDVLLLRTNPARDQGRPWAHDAALAIARLVEERGVLVLNRPDGLLKAASKLYLQHLPASARPRTLVSSDPAAIQAFVGALDGPAVLKPLQGTRGQGVFFIESAADKNLKPLLDVLLAQGLVMAQVFVPEATAGDVRVVVMNGQILTVEGRAAAIRRIPAPDDFRSNLHAGGHAAPADVTDAMRAVVEQIGPLLVRDGLFLVGLDFIGSKIVEVNVFSTGGLDGAERFEGVDFTGAIWAALEARVEAAGDGNSRAADRT